MPADLSLLVSELHDKARMLQEKCLHHNVEMRANTGLRDPFEQARLWRQSRSLEEIKAKISEYKAARAPFLAHCIESVGAQDGKRVTNAPPGISWHQWGEAVDFFWLVDGKAEWSSQKLIKGVNGYQVLAKQAALLGLDAGGLWKKFKDWPHVQRPHKANAGNVHTIQEINAAMDKRFAG